MPASNRAEFQAIAEERIADAAALLAIPRYPAAYYLAGYAVECGLKACVAKLTREHDFPVRETRDIYTHDLGKLVNSAGLQTSLMASTVADPQFEISWSIVTGWKEDARYELRTEAEARQMYDAAVAVLTWIKTQW